MTGWAAVRPARVSLPGRVTPPSRVDHLDRRPLEAGLRAGELVGGEHWHHPDDQVRFGLRIIRPPRGRIIRRVADRGVDLCGDGDSVTG